MPEVSELRPGQMWRDADGIDVEIVSQTDGHTYIRMPGDVDEVCHRDDELAALLTEYGAVLLPADEPTGLRPEHQDGDPWCSFQRCRAARQCAGVEQMNPRKAAPDSGTTGGSADA